MNRDMSASASGRRRSRPVSPTPVSSSGSSSAPSSVRGARHVRHLGDPGAPEVQANAHGGPGHVLPSSKMDLPAARGAAELAGLRRGIRDFPVAEAVEALPDRLNRDARPERAAGGKDERCLLGGVKVEARGRPLRPDGQPRHGRDHSGHCQPACRRGPIEERAARRVARRSPFGRARRRICGSARVPPRLVHRCHRDPDLDDPEQPENDDQKHGNSEHVENHWAHSEPPPLATSCSVATGNLLRRPPGLAGPWKCQPDRCAAVSEPTGCAPTSWCRGRDTATHGKCSNAVVCAFGDDGMAFAPGRSGERIRCLPSARRAASTPRTGGSNTGATSDPAAGAQRPGTQRHPGIRAARRLPLSAASGRSSCWPAC